jgi:archaellum component FlaC
MTAETDNLVLDILGRVHGDLAELRSGQQDIPHRLSLIETRLAGIDRNLADQYASDAGQSARIDRLEDRLGRIERRLELTD